MNFELLANYESALPAVASWYYQEWGYLNHEETIEHGIEKLQAYLNKDQLPLILLSIENGIPVGAAQLKLREMNIYPDKLHWLGGVYVEQEFRGRGIATQIILQIITIAKKMKITTLYLQTEHLDGGLYGRLGWEAIEQVTYNGVEVLVMGKEI